MTTNEPNNSFPFEFTDGLTRRELFAAVALQGLLANPNNSTANLSEELVPRAVKVADVLIALLDYPTQKDEAQKIHPLDNTRS